MKGSANEVMTLASKAARGAGAPPAQAVMFGQAALCHLVAGRAEEDLTAALDVLPSGPIFDLYVFFQELIEIFEGGTLTRVIPPEPKHELILSYVDAQPFRAVVMEGNVLHADLKQPRRVRPTARVALSDDLANAMNDLAARLLVPESDASRLSGAGAGLTDND